ncbi:aldehyde dehydrogenase family protein [Paracoccaceae bacterium Fryx2]|nr:aldehyde dehydrogenase family protein [Paracoccaceae bacterium Fryx2]
MTDVLLTVPDAVYEQARLKIERSRWASVRFQKLDRAATQRIVQAVAEAAHGKAQFYAEWAVRETGMGVVAHKRQKNEACSRGLAELYGAEDFVTPRVDAARKIVELPRPAGVIFALIPVTNPVATVYFKTMLALMTRNAIILSPHPGAREVCADAARVLSDAARAVGAPDGVIQVIEDPTIPLIERLIADERVDLVIATGGPAVVKAAYRSGNPAFGVGPGNAPVLVDDSADLKLAARRIVASKSFDNSILCTSESTLLAFASVADALLAALKAEGAHVCTPAETGKLRTLLFNGQGFNPAMIGKDAAIIAREAGFAAPGARILITPVDLVQPEEKLVREKLCPVLAFARVGGMDQAISCARSMMRTAGRGHSAAIHSHTEAHVMAFAAALPALRVAVNAGCSLGSSGFETNLGPSMTIGTGFAGGSSLSDNLTPHHLLQFARIAYNKDASESFGNFSGMDPLHLPLAEPRALPALRDTDLEDLRRELRKIILEELSAVRAA